ncbi:MAG: hypothetical protein AB7O44_32380 [Hyphomicrobiaceae bacterium]
MATIKTVTCGDASGIVFFDDEWDAYGWKTGDFTNGPFDSADAAESALRDELEGEPQKLAVLSPEVAARYFGKPNA